MPGKRDAISSCVTGPWRKIHKVSVLQSIMVDSTPDWQGPSSRIIAILSPRSASTCVANVGLMRPDKLADGAAMGQPTSESRALTFSGAGTRSAIVSRPAVTKREIADGARNGTTTVSGPGQNCFASCSAVSEKAPIDCAASNVGTCAMSGLKEGRPLAL